MRLRASAVVAAACILGLLGCDKLRGTKGEGEGGAPATGIGGGALSFLDGAFEGEISMNLTTKTKSAAKTPTQMVIGIKKPKYRIDSTDPSQPQAAGSFIIDPPLKKAYALSHPQKTAMVIDFDKMKNMKGGAPGVPNAKGPATPSAPPKIEKTGKKEVIAGYTCEIWIITTEKNKADVCAAEGITWFDMSDMGMSNPEMAIAAAMGANRFPLRLISYDLKGTEEMRMEATKVDKKTLEESRFVVPPDYRVVDMGALMGGMGGASGGMPPNFKPPQR